MDLLLLLIAAELETIASAEVVDGLEIWAVVCRCVSWSR